MALTLFHYWRSSSSWRVRWGLELKGLQYELKDINLLSGEEKAPAYIAQNPAGYVPCLIVDGKPPLAESLAILEWLEETHPQASFFSGDSFQRAFIRRLAESVNSGIQPLQNPTVQKEVSTEKDRQLRWTQHWIQRGLSVYETLLNEGGFGAKKFSVSDEPSLADLCLIPQVYGALRNHIDMNAYPRCKAIYEYALTTPACMASHPDTVKPKD